MPISTSGPPSSSDPTVPTADSTANSTQSQVIGNKADAAQATIGVTRSLMSYVKAAVSGVHRSNWPFEGLFGDGSDGAISGTQTATKMVVQATNFTLTNQTYTVKQQNPGGLLLAVSGTFTMDATSIIDANGQGALGGATQQSTTSGGKSGAPGKGFAGRGGNGGGNGSQYGGQAGPVLYDAYGDLLSAPSSAASIESIFGRNNQSGSANGPYLSVTASNFTSDTYLNFKAWITPAPVGTGVGTAGTAWSAITFPHDIATAFNIALSLGWGGGGASGANLSGDSGAGGNGGGLVLIVCNTFNFAAGAIIRAAGNAGSAGAAVSSGGGGGGGGGRILILYRNLTANAGTLTVSGGAAGAGAGVGSAAGAGGLGSTDVGVI